MHIGVNNLPKVGMRLLPWIGFESSPCWSQVQLSTHCATAPPYESWKQFILGQRVESGLRGTRNIAGVGFCTLVSAGFFQF